jgi:hypothetical protein
MLKQLLQILQLPLLPAMKLSITTTTTTDIIIFNNGLILAVRLQQGKLQISIASIPDRIESSLSCIGRFPALNEMTPFL